MTEDDLEAHRERAREIEKIAEILSTRVVDVEYEVLTGVSVGE